MSNWKRIQGSNGRYQAFGFCDFEHPEGTMRALRILDGFCIGGKKLTVKVFYASAVRPQSCIPIKAEEKTIKMIQDFVQVQRSYKGQPRLILKEGELPKDEETLKDDERIRASIEQACNEVDPVLLTEPPEGKGQRVCCLTRQLDLAETKESKPEPKPSSPVKRAESPPSEEGPTPRKVTASLLACPPNACS